MPNDEKTTNPDGGTTELPANAPQPADQSVTALEEFAAVEPALVALAATLEEANNAHPAT